MRLSRLVETYIAHKRSLGMLFVSDAVRLHAYVKAMDDVDIRRIRPAAVRKFLDGAGPVTAFWFSKYHTLSSFYRYALAHHYVSNNPLPLTKPRAPARFEPYIYTNQEVEPTDRRRRLAPPVRLDSSILTRSGRCCCCSTLWGYGSAKPCD